MTDGLILFLIAIGVCALAFVVWLIKMFVDGRKQRRRVREFRQDIARQERTFGQEDDTKTWPPPPGGMK